MITVPLTQRLSEELDRERSRREVKQQAQAFRQGWRSLNALQLDPTQPTPGDLNPAGFVYEFARQQHPALRPSLMFGTLGGAGKIPPVSDTNLPPSYPPSFQGGGDIRWGGTGWGGWNPAALSNPLTGLQGVADWPVAPMAELRAINILAQQRGVSPAQIVNPPSDYERVANQAALQPLIAQETERMIPAPGIPGLVSAATTPWVPPDLLRPVTSHLGPAGPPIERAVGGLTSPVVAASILAGGPELLPSLGLGLLGQIAAGTAGETFGLPAPAQYAVEAAGGWLGGGLGLLRRPAVPRETGVPGEAVLPPQPEPSLATVTEEAQPGALVGARAAAEAPSGAVEPARALPQAEAAPPLPFDIRPQFGSTQRQFMGEQGGIQAPMFTPEQVGQQGQIGLGDVMPAATEHADVLRDIQAERLLQQDILNDPRTGRIAGATAEARQRLASLQAEEALVRDAQGKPLSQVADQLAEDERRLYEAQQYRLAGQEGFGARPRFGDMPLQRAKRPMPEGHLSSDALKAHLNAIDAVRARLGIPDPLEVQLAPELPEDAKAWVIHNEAEQQRPLQLVGGAEGQMVGTFRPLADVANDIVRTDNPFLRVLAGHSGVNPNVLVDTPLQLGYAAYRAQDVTREALLDNAVRQVFDLNQDQLGRIPIHLDADGFATNVTPRAAGASLQWNDILSRPGDYSFSAPQAKFVQDWHRAIGDVEFNARQAGVTPLITSGRQATKEGWLWVPRQVKGVRGIDIVRPSNPSLERVYEQAQAGAAQGVDYASPEATFRLHVNNRLRLIQDAQLADWVEQHSVAPKELLLAKDRDLVQHYSDALIARLQAERALRAAKAAAYGEEWTSRLGSAFSGQTYRESGLAEDISRTQQSFRASRADIRQAMDAEIARAQTALDAARAQHLSAKATYSNALKRAAQAAYGPGELFGKEGEIALGQWHNRLMPREDAQLLNDQLGRAGIRPEPNWFMKNIQVTGNMIRAGSLLFHANGPLVYGLNLLGRPAIWGRSAATFYGNILLRGQRGVADVIASDPEAFNEMAQYGLPAARPEHFQAFERGQGGSLPSVVRDAPVVRQALSGFRWTVGRFTSGYDGLLARARLDLWHSLSSTEPTERAQIIRDMTAGLDTRALGVGPNQRAVESTFLAFTPRLLRSNLALVSDLRYGLLDARGREAWRSMAGLAGAAASVYTLTGLALGKPWPEIVKGFNPLAGKKFLSYDINGDWIGMPGEMRAILQLLVKSAAHPFDLADPSLRGNPLIAFASGHIGPGSRLLGSMFGAASLDDQGNLHVGGLDLAKQLGKATLPFAVQAAIERQGIGGITARVVGGRTSAETPTETARARFAQAGVPFDQTNWRAVARSNPALADLVQPSPQEEQATAQLAPQIDTLRQVAQALQQGNLQAGEQFRRDYADYVTSSVNITNTLFYGAKHPDPTTPEGQTWKQLVELRPELDPQTLRPNLDAYEEKRKALIAQMPAAWQEALTQKMRLPPDLQWAETALKEARSLRGELAQLSPIRGMDATEHRQLEQVYGRASNLIELAQSAGRRISEVQAIRRAAADLDVPLSQALRYRPGSPARRAGANPDYYRFLDQHKDALEPFYPSLYRDKRVARYAQPSIGGEAQTQAQPFSSIYQAMLNSALFSGEESGLPSLSAPAPAYP